MAAWSLAAVIGDIAIGNLGSLGFSCHSFKAVGLHVGGWGSFIKCFIPISALLQLIVFFRNLNSCFCCFLKIVLKVETLSLYLFT
jgi:hypothetical protein